MKFNLLNNSYVTVSGTVEFTVEDMINILAVSGTVTISGSGSDSVWIDCDLVDRIGIDEIRYYFNSTTDSGTVASGIFFSYKNDEPDYYTNTVINIGPGYYYSTISAPSAPRYVKLNHDLSGTSVSGTIVGFQVLNNDDVINFGSDGTLTSTYVLTSLNYLNYSDYIKKIQVYNSGDTVATAHVMLDPQYNDSDELLSISASESGPWVYARNTDYIVANGNNWDGGQYNGTTSTGIADGKLRLDSGYTVGTYTTPIFQNQSVKFAYLDVLQTAISGALVAVDSVDYTSTLQIRSNNTKPIDYKVYRRLCANSAGDGYWYKEYLMSTDTELYDSYNATGSYLWPRSTSYKYTSLYSSQFAEDPNTRKIGLLTSCKGYDIPTGNDVRQYVDIFIASKEGVELYARQIAIHQTPTLDIEMNDLKFDSNEGLWTYLYMATQSLSGSSDLYNVGHYLIHYSSTLTVLYNSGPQSSDFIIGAWDTAADNQSVWYCNQLGTMAVIKLDSTGTVLVTYDIDTTDLKGLCSTADGGCWFINGDNLYKLSSTGVLENSITSFTINNELTFVGLDSEDSDAFWIVDGVYVKRVASDGRVYSSTYFEGFTIRRLLPTTEGIWVYCTENITGDQYAKYVGKISEGVDKTIECIGGTAGCVGDPCDPISAFIAYDDQVLGSTIPLADDPTWNSSLEWNKAVTANAILPREEYNQLKLTLRRPNTGIDSPTVENIYYQDNVELENIYPGQSKTLYLKISIPDGMSVSGDYSSMLRVWWEVLAT